jgi:hypothetical protein
MKAKRCYDREDLLHEIKMTSKVYDLTRGLLLHDPFNNSILGVNLIQPITNLN